MLYDLVRPALFRFDAEKVHEFALRRLERWSTKPRVLKTLRSRYFLEDPRLSQELLGIAAHDAIASGGGYLGAFELQDPVELIARGEL